VILFFVGEKMARRHMDLHTIDLIIVFALVIGASSSPASGHF
jgi:hypothetical protein